MADHSLTDQAKKKDPAVEVQNLTVGYEHQSILEHLNFKIPCRQIAAVVGGSGCGKSTLLKHLVGLYEPMEGKILIDGENFSQASEKEKQRIWRKIGIAYQGGALLRSLTVYENTALPLEECRRIPENEIHDRVMQQLALVQLDSFASYYP